MHYSDFCTEAFDDFLEHHWPCSYVDRRKRPCANKKSGHAKGHQTAKGVVIQGGEYQNPVPYEGFRDNWLHSIRQNVERIGDRVEDIIPAGHYVTKEPRNIHCGEIQVSYRRLGGADKFRSHFTCFCCLQEMPEHPLPCGHVLCERCIFSYGEVQDQVTVEMEECPLHAYKFPPPRPLVHFKPPDAGVRILSLDGGGIRGIVELEVLRKLEKHLGGKTHISKFFDLIVGTSTGGIIALGLGVKGSTVDECIVQYRELSKAAFTTKIIVGPSRLSTQYKSRPLENCLQNNFREKYLFGGQDQEISANLTKVAVTASTETGRAAVLFTNYNHPTFSCQGYHVERQDSSKREMRVWEAYVLHCLCSVLY